MGTRDSKDRASRAMLQARTPAAINPVAITAAEAAEYIKDLATELASLAAKSRLPLLAYLLEMVRSEAAAGAPVPDAYRGNGTRGSAGEMSATRSPP